MKRPTPEEIKKEIELLQDLQPRVRHMSMFGDDNRAAISAQIDVLKNGLDAYEICDAYDRAGIAFNVHDAAMEARDWLDGELDEEPVGPGLAAGWKALAQ